ncbi:RNA-directed DNA polymerase [Halalkalibacterium halodurans]|uniref:RNA-directed DNA polymerase n=1 Tax=Halalkalibacterium halodurans TaxID=86665 RepID=UPI002AA9FAC0|nr:RNA-directed DNA polymerase [Halalkalibacterium halodurans]MDY7224520.1 RNA-directed DNA polymerase [Halalkalibacterium halodurans]MDY7243805.1 RNA-directed DNA polymerase [Halalkalibacterium halodurans]
MSRLQISDLTYKYIHNMSKLKKYNPQAIANMHILNKYGQEAINYELEKGVKEFCKTNPIKKTRDFVYKSDYFTPRNMYLISPIYYIYYTNIVFGLAHTYLNNNSKLDFSRNRMKIFYSGLLDFNTKEGYFKKNAIYNQSFKAFQKEKQAYVGKTVLKLDLQDFFNSIKVNSLIKKLKFHLGEQKLINDLNMLLDISEFNYLPQFHYSMASSILSQFYLLDFDKKMEQVLEREDLFLIRFVDDMFIISLQGDMSLKKYNSLLNEISFFLWEDELVLNSSKTKLLSTEEYKVSVELAETEYEDNERSFSSEKIVDERAKEIIEKGYLITLVKELCKLEKNEGIDLSKYKDLTTEYISINGEDTRKVLNNIIFSGKWKFLSDKDLLKLINNWKYILFNPSQFTILYILICRHLENKGITDGTKIKSILNYLFRNKNFTFRDTLVAVAYLFQNNKKHSDLLRKIETVNPNYVNFIESFIKISKG